MSAVPVRYMDTGETIYDMMARILVVCPRCKACAIIMPQPAITDKLPDYFTPHRLVCGHCGLIKEWAEKSLGFDWYADPMRDSYFGLPLWLQTRCCGHVLWAYNLHHRDIIEQYIGADTREHRPDAVNGWRNKSLVNRLPEWMIVARHRTAVLNAIANLKQNKNAQ